MRLLILSAALICLLQGAAAQEARLPAISIIIDDIGYRYASDRDAIGLPGPLAVAILPHSPHAREMAELAAQNGKDVLMHLPMEADTSRKNRHLGPGALTHEMGHEEFIRTLDLALDSVPGAVGVNNHMGSGLTRQPLYMGWLMEALKSRNKFYIDSMTSNRSVAAIIALEKRIPHLRRDVFLDNAVDTRHIRAQFRELVDTARRRGHALAIGHPHAETIAVLRVELQDLAGQGVSLISVQMLVNQSEQARRELLGNL